MMISIDCRNKSRTQQGIRRFRPHLPPIRLHVVFGRCIHRGDSALREARIETGTKQLGATLPTQDVTVPVARAIHGISIYPTSIKQRLHGRRHRVDQ
jgi:hypothetical protein